MAFNLGPLSKLPRRYRRRRHVYGFAVLAAPLTLLLLAAGAAAGARGALAALGAETAAHVARLRAERAEVRRQAWGVRAT